MNTRRHGRSHRNSIEGEIDERGEERRNTHYGILEKLGGRGLDTHYGEAVKSTRFTTEIIIGGGGNTATHTFVHYIKHGSDIVGPMGEEAWLSFIPTTFALRVVHCLDWVLQHRSTALDGS